ncbi:MAG: hypothetical protein EOO07_18340 [Chitinophagaceae bacterium]|nr:MAG: hypothetical protein EOO07_18340 [Chitinophagaceae bacterium]
MSNYPTEINNLHQTIGNLKRIANVCSGIDNLFAVNTEDLKLVDFSHLPIATLLRTNGGLQNEILLQIEFTIDNTKESLISLEFLSWFVRDQARSGTKIQLRTFALPPQSQNGSHLGETLKFHIDYFFDGITDSLTPVLNKVDELDKALKLLIGLYEIPTKG